MPLLLDTCISFPRVTDTAGRLADNLAASSLIIDAESLAALDVVSALHAEYPGWMLKMQGRYRAEAPANQAK